MTFEMKLDKVNRAAGGKVFVILEGPDCSLRGYVDAGDVPDFEHVYKVEVREAE